MDTLNVEIKSITGRIDRIKEDLNHNEGYLDWLMTAREVSESELYSGLILKLKFRLEDVKERNNMYGFNQHETNLFSVIPSAFVDVGDCYFRKTQKEIITDYFKSNHKVKKVVFVMP